MQEYLTKADLSTAQKTLYEISQAEQLAAAMERCGLEVGEAKERCQHYRNLMEGIRREFGGQMGPKGETSKS